MQSIKINVIMNGKEAGRKKIFNSLSLGRNDRHFVIWWPYLASALIGLLIWSQDVRLGICAIISESQSQCPTFVIFSVVSCCWCLTSRRRVWNACQRFSKFGQKTDFRKRRVGDGCVRKVNTRFFYDCFYYYCQREKRSHFTTHRKWESGY